MSKKWTDFTKSKSVADDDYLMVGGVTNGNRLLLANQALPILRFKVLEWAPLTIASGDWVDDTEVSGMFKYDMSNQVNLTTDSMTTFVMFADAYVSSRDTLTDEIKAIESAKIAGVASYQDAYIYGFGTKPTIDITLMVLIIGLEDGYGSL